MPAVPETTPPADGATVRYWAAARSAAGCDSEVVVPGTVAEVLDQLRRRHAKEPRFARVLGVCSVLVGDQPVGTKDHAAVMVRNGDMVELLPPFAGG